MAAETRTAVVAPVDDRKQFFEEEGYLIVEDVMSSEEVAACEAEIDRLHEIYADLKTSQDPALEHFQKEPFAAGDNGGRPVLRKVEQTGSVSDLFGSLSAHPKLVPVVQELLGPDLLLFRSTLMLKPAFHGSIHGLHQDSAYWPMEPPSLVTVSIALSDTSEENGCIQVIPGSQKQGKRDVEEWGHIAREQDETLTDRGDIAEDDLVLAPIRAGSALMFHSLLVHGSGPNRSPHPRHTALYAYFPPTVRYCPSENEPKQRAFLVVAGLDGKTGLTLEAD